MLLADRDPRVVAYAAQTVEFVWPMNSDKASHVVDLIVWRNDGSVQLIDSHVTFDEDFDAQRSLTERACEQIGWEYKVFDGLNIARERNLYFLAADRHWWVVCGREALLDRLVDQAATPISIADLSVAASPEAPHVARPVIYYALWCGFLNMNWDRRLTSRTLVHATLSMKDL